MTELNEKNFAKEVIDYKGTVMVDFHADWCGPCKAMAPIFEEVAGETEGVKFCRLNVDEARELAVRYGVMSIPAVVVFENGKVVNQATGMQSKDHLLSLVGQKQDK